jgi:hypothetical protein
MVLQQDSVENDAETRRAIGSSRLHFRDVAHDGRVGGDNNLPVRQHILGYFCAHLGTRLEFLPVH